MDRRVYAPLALLSLAVFALPDTARAADAGIAFDQVTYAVRANGARPAPGHFEEAYQQAQSAASLLAQQHPMTADERRKAVSDIRAKMAAATAAGVASGIGGPAGSLLSAAQSSIISGMNGQYGRFSQAMAGPTLMRFAFNDRGWERLEIPAFHSVAIAKPAEHTMILMDTQAHTWSEIDNVDDAELAAGTKRLGSATAVYDGHASNLGTGNAGEYFTERILSQGVLTLSDANGTCQARTSALAVTSYVITAFQTPALLQSMDVQKIFGRGPGCVVNVAGAPALDGFVLMRIVDVNGGATGDLPGSDPLSAVLRAQHDEAYKPGGIGRTPTLKAPETEVTERGHIHALTAADGALFVVPPDYRKVEAAPPTG